MADAMIMDSRYFPWFEQLYTSSDHRHGHLSFDGFLMTGGDAYRMEDKAEKDAQRVFIPELFGTLNFTEVGNAMTLAGLKNPIPADWRWLSDFGAVMPSSLEGQGFGLEGFWPISKHFGIGGSTVFMRLNSLVKIMPTIETVKKLYLSQPGNEAQFTQMLSDFYRELQINSLASHEVGAGDTLVYALLYDVREYEYKMRKIDASLWFGAIIPSGVTRNPYNLASIPYGGDGMWGIFIAPTAEFELKEDLKVGMQLRVIQRFHKDTTMRLPLKKEQPLFAPVIGRAHVTPGLTVAATLYAAIEDLRAGFGAEGKYTIIYHEKDRFCVRCTKEKVNGKVPDMENLMCRSNFISEYGTVRLFYDIAHDKPWKHRPLVSLTWDIPFNNLWGKAFARTNRIVLGCTVNF